MKTFFVIGNPIEHSKSPIIHKHFAQQCNVEISYERMFCNLDDFEDDLLNAIKGGLAGANVTMPFKERAFAMCYQVSERAQLSKATNTLTIQDGKVYGDNTDGEGLVQDLLYNGIAIKDKKVLVIGAGGATRGCIPALLQQQPKQIVITNRTFEKASLIAKEIGSNKVVAQPTLELDDDYDIIINGTATSLNGQLPPVGDCIYDNATAVYDMCYQNDPTVFMQHAQKINPDIIAIDGLGMLIEQAAESFNIWFGQRPTTKELREILRAS